MKKTLIALAAVAATGAAFAQSTVTLYGRLDASLVNQSSKLDGVKQYPTTKTGIDSSQLNTQFWGFKGSEDLGGGLKANFKLESNFNIDNGAVDSTGMFAREANVGVSGGFGEVKLGRNYTAYDNLAGAVNHTLNSNINVTGAVNATGLATYATRVENSVHYSSPDVGGVSGTISYGFGENKTAALSATNNTSLQVRYAQGPLLVGVAHMKATSQTLLDLKHNLVGASYDLGVVKLTGSYQTAKQNVTKDKEYQVGVTVPMGALTLSAGYADSQSKTGAATLNGDGFALVAIYDLSKRTSVYAGHESTKVQATDGTTKATNMAFGVRHTF